ncbi:MAG TPA: hypothetical protein ENN08_05425, partial [Bacteroidales bacterium]|nr:hypothetical protein [Bacteroidales bacterium]
MKKAAIAVGLIFLLMIPKLKSQIPTFEFLLATPMDEVISDIFEDQEGFIYFTARQYNVGFPDFHQGLILKMDFQGNIVNSKLFSFPGKNVFPRRIFPSENQLYDVVGWSYDEYGIGSGIILYKMDSNLDFVQETSYHFPDEAAVKHVRAGKESNQDISVFGVYITPQSQHVPYAYVFN